MRVDPILLLHFRETPCEPNGRDHANLAAAITKAASKHTYYTIRLLADRSRVGHAYRAYAYFRWVDDYLDGKAAGRAERIGFLERQQMLVNRCYRGETLDDLCPEEALLAQLIASDSEAHSGLQAYIRNLMAVMAFDTERRGRLISQGELAEYSCHLATGVTEALHYFIGHNDNAPHTDERYLAVTGAHITHMLRDTCEDSAAGYFNIPCEFLEAHRLDPCAVQNDAYREWVESRVRLARRCFEAGKRYLAQVRNRRCRFAGYAYMTRFEHVLDTIEHDGYRLRAAYPENDTLYTELTLARSTLSLFSKSSI
ncbi:MAG TPA: squalene/phytoene synthase family protein [Phototrophicaceae bacterium]|nr:squalene/phytoene synthase family protein [Phototrophicaceae bacterium]